MGEYIRNTPKCERSTIPDPNIRTRQLVNTNSQMFNYQHNVNQPDTALVRNANKYVNKVWEDTTSHYNFLAKLGRSNAEYYKNSAWCALTVSILAKEAGINIGADFIPTVDGFVNWAGRRYKKISTIKLNASNVKQERQRRAGEILAQIKSGNMKEGDFIIWKGDKAVKKDQKWQINQASHIGIIESVDRVKGTVTVIEGNANITMTDGTGEPLLVKTRQEGRNGNQNIGEVQEKNPHDGLIRKTYTFEELARNGYSGYIDNAGIVR